jgi:hypothetical protein
MTEGRSSTMLTMWTVLCVLLHAPTAHAAITPFLPTEYTVRRGDAPSPACWAFLGMC